MIKKFSLSYLKLLFDPLNLAFVVVALKNRDAKMIDILLNCKHFVRNVYGMKIVTIFEDDDYSDIKSFMRLEQQYL